MDNINYSLRYLSLFYEELEEKIIFIVEMLNLKL